MKRLIVIVSVFLLCTLLTVGALLLALRSARVQTAAVALFTEELRRTLHVDVRVDRVDIDPPLALSLQGLYMADDRGDTLLAVPHLRVRFNPFALEEKRLSFPLVQIDSPYFRLVQDSAYTNVDFLMRLFKQDNPQPFTYALECRRIRLTDARVRYIHVPSGTDITVTDIETDAGFRYAKGDSLAASLRRLHLKAQMASIDGYVEADVHGSPDTLYADRLNVVYQNRQLMSGDVWVSQPMRRDSLFVHADLTDLYANAGLLSSLLGDVLHRPVQLPSEVVRMGDIHYRGVVEGRLNDLHLHGGFITRLGTVSTDATVRDLSVAQGKVTLRGFALGRLLNQSDLGRLSATLHVQAEFPEGRFDGADLQGLVSRLDYHGYTYFDIHLAARASQDVYSAKINIDTSDLGLDMDALLTMQDDRPQLTARLDVPRADLAALHLTDSTLRHAVSFRSRMAWQTDQQAALDRLEGEWVIDSLLLRGCGHRLLVPQMSITMQADSSAQRLQLFSPILTAGMDGHFAWSTLPATLQAFANRALPSFVAAPKAHAVPNDLDFYAYLLHTEDLVHVLFPNTWQIPYAQTIKGFVHESDSAYSLQMTVPEIINGNASYRNLTFALNNATPDRTPDLFASVSQHTLSLDSTRLRVGDLQASVHMTAAMDEVVTALEFGSPLWRDTVPDVLFRTTFSRYQQQPAIHMHILPSSFRMGREQWHVEEANLCYTAADTLLQINNLHLFTDNQGLQAQGRLSTHMDDSVHVALQDMDLGYILSATQILDAVDIQGRVTGWATLYGAFASPKFEANVSMPHGYINGTDLGCVSAQAKLGDAGDVLINGQAVLDSVQIAGVTGRVTSKPTYWEIFIDANGAPLAFINRWTEGIIDDIDGRGYGKVHVFGTKMNTWVTARAYAQDGALTIPYTGCRYFFSDSVILDTTYISFPEVHIRDAEGNRGVVSGLLTHQQFNNLNYHISLSCQDLMAIDLPSSPLHMYYGRAYATGNVDIKGDERETYINVNAATAGNTDFYLSIATASDATSSDFITFRRPMQDSDEAETDTLVETVQPQSRIWLNLEIEAVPTSRVHLVLDAHNGDGIVGRGEGNLRLSMNATTGDVQLLGAYTLLNGTFSYTVGNLVHRDFSIAEGSTVTWSGDPTEPDLDITARYRCTASLRDLFGSDVTSVTSRSSIPVDCVVRLTGPLSNMAMHFGVEFPQTEESVAAQIYAIINSESMLMRQVVYLLVFNRFYTPDYMRTTGTGVGANEAYSLLSSTVTGQINSWISKLTDMVNVGFNMRTDGDAGNQSYEYEAQVQIQPIDRLTINGNVGYRYNDITNKPFFGDADVEYELTPDGKFRAKVFTHSVDKYSLKQSGMQEGVGFVFRHDFNPGDAKAKKKRK